MNTNPYTTAENILSKIKSSGILTNDESVWLHRTVRSGFKEGFPFREPQQEPTEMVLISEQEKQIWGMVYSQMRAACMASSSKVEAVMFSTQSADHAILELRKRLPAHATKLADYPRISDMDGEELNR